MPENEEQLHDRVFREGLAREAVSLRLAALVKASLELSSMQDPQKLLDTFALTAGNIIGASIVTAGTLDGGGPLPACYSLVGITAEVALSPVPENLLKKLSTEPRLQPVRKKNPSGDPTLLGLPSNRPPLYSYLAIPMVSHSKTYGWLSLYNKIGADEFSAQDERLALALTSQVAVIYENILRSKQIQLQLVELEKEVAERREVEKKQSRFSRILENTTDTVKTSDMEGRALYLNRAGRKAAGLAENEELPSISFLELIPPDERDKFHNEVLPTILRDGVWSGETVLSSYTNKTDRFASRVIVLHRGADGTPEAISTIARDITEQKHLEERQALLVSILDNTSSAIGICDMESRFIYLNRYARQILHIGEQDDLTNHPVLEKQLASGRPAFDADVIPVLLRDSVWSGEVTYQGGDGKDRTSWRTCILHRSPEGEPRYISTVGRDITEQKRTEEQLRQAQKMEAIGQLAGGVAHDFNNILMVIMGYSSFLIDSFEPSDPRSEDMMEINSAAERAASLTRQLLAFSRQEVVQPKTLELNKLVAEVDKMIKRLIGEDIDVGTVLSPSLGQMKADPGQIEQVVMNLAVNARDAMPKGGKLTIETSNVELDASYTNQHLGVSAGSYVMLAVSDTGCGMSKEIQSRIFEPFFTTKDKGRGTGLGLSTVYGIVQQSGGHITVYSELDRGTTFKVYLPRIDEDLTKKSAPLVLVEERVFLVEDDASVRRIVHHILQKQGYTIVEARDGKEALSLIEKAGDIDLLITDVVMPEMSGPEMVKLIKEKRPTLKVLYLSGYTDNAISRHGLLDTGFAFLQKPFTPDALKNKVREVLEGKQ